MAARVDLIGIRFGRLTVVSRADDYISPKGAHQHQWVCVCDCGNESIASTSNLRGGRKQSCGCITTKALTGIRFGRLTVVKRAEDLVSRSGTHRSQWLCLCDCGNEKVVQARFLIDGTTVSCGCYAKERNTEAHTKHGGSYGRMYRIWNGMKDRCYNPKNGRFNRYGGRGISVCPAWLNSFQAFHDWAIENGYDDDLSIDRINNDGNYEPGNCRWATPKEQANNRSTSFRGRECPKGAC